MSSCVPYDAFNVVTSVGTTYLVLSRSHTDTTYAVTLSEFFSSSYNCCPE